VVGEEGKNIKKGAQSSQIRVRKEELGGDKDK
jgi:hypothetical protein